MTPTLIRRATPDDAEILLDFIRALARYEHEPDAVHVTAAVLRADLAQAQPPFECLLAERGGAPVGFALYFFTYSTWRGRRVLYLEDLFVDPAARRLGVGETLMRALARTAVARGCARFDWSVLDWNSDAHAFYRALGAEPRNDWTVWRVDDAALERLAGSAPAAAGGEP